MNCDPENRLIVMCDALAAASLRPMNPKVRAELAQRALAIARVAMAD